MAYENRTVMAIFPNMQCHIAINISNFYNTKTEKQKHFQERKMGQIVFKKSKS